MVLYSLQLICLCRKDHWIRIILMFASLMSKQKAAKNAAVLELSCVQHKLCQSMSFDAALLMVREAPWLS